MTLVRPLEDDWRATLDAVAAERGFPSSSDTTKIAQRVARLSAIYNDRSARAPGADDRDALAARLLFSFARDVPKGTGAVRELAAAGLLPRERPLRILDVGAGLGAMTWGVARALGDDASVEADLCDHHKGALELAATIARVRGGGVKIRTRVGTADQPSTFTGTYDVVVLGQVLSELDREASDADRVARHVALLARYLPRVRDDGSLVVVEPALRDRTRHLHRVRDAIAAARSATIFAPCLHAAPCPMLARETDWCHEDLPVDLPAWLVPIARAAGLRFQGLTFSYLVLRRDGASLGALHPAASLLRDVSGVVRTKGKTERILCGRTTGLALGGGVRAMRLDRAATDANAAWDDAARGDVMAFEPPLPAERARIEKETTIERLGVDANQRRR